LSPLDRWMFGLRFYDRGLQESADDILLAGTSSFSNMPNGRSITQSW
jgi:hypothetical protein